jgi:tripartite-type tricarboxylate transporter receptor subunit TctC
MKIPKRLFFSLITQTFLSLVCCLSISVFAASYPDRPMKWIIPYPPGGTTDVIARNIAQNMSEQLGQPIVIENKPGAGGQIAMNYVAKAPADGYTLLVSDASLATVQSLYKSLPFNPQADLAAVSLFVTVPHIVVVNPALKVSSLNELIRLNKQQAEKMVFSSGGLGSPLHLAGESLKLATGLDWLHVPYKGAGPAIFAVVSNEAQIATPSLPAVLAQIQGKKLDALAIMGDKRSPALPNVPTVLELGYPKATAIGWVGLHAPAGVDAEVLSKLAVVTKRSLKNPLLQSRLQEQGATISSDINSGEYAKFVGIQSAHWNQVVKSAGIQAE